MKQYTYQDHTKKIRRKYLFRNLVSRFSAFFLLLSIFVAFTGVLVGLDYASRSSTTITETCTVHSVTNAGSSYQVKTSCGRMLIGPDYVGKQFLPYDRKNQLEKGKTYELTTAGPFLKNIIHIKLVDSD